MKAILLRDIHSHVKKRTYGKKHQQVTIVATRGHVRIVELNNNRFPVSEGELQIL